jgi:hypothetical protein
MNPSILIEAIDRAEAVIAVTQPRITSIAV